MFELYNFFTGTTKKFWDRVINLIETENETEVSQWREFRIVVMRFVLWNKWPSFKFFELF